MLGGQASRMLVQAIYFVLLARVVGADGFGIFSAAIALAAIVTPFSSLGTNILMIRSVARGSTDDASQWRRAAILTAIGGLTLSTLIVVLAGFLMPPGLSRVALFLIVVSDLLGMKLLETAAAFWQSKGFSRPLLVWPVLLNLFRLGGVLLLMAIGSQSVDLWGVLYFAASVPIAAVVSIYTTIKAGVPTARISLSREDIKEGMLFSVGLSSQSIYNDIDKAMLARLGSATDAGIYAAAYRLIDMAYVPVRAISATTYPRFFQAGQIGVRGSLQLVKKVAPLTFGYGVFAAACLALGGPLVVLLLGPTFAGVDSVLPFLAIILVTRSATYLAGDALSGADLFRSRTVVQVAIAVINVGVNFLVIPAFGIWGAVLSSLLCEILLAAALWLIVFLRSLREGTYE